MDVGTVLRVWYFVIFLLELSWQCGILLFFMDVGTVLTVWYFVVFHRCWNCPELSWQCGILLFFTNIHEKQHRKTTKSHTVRTVPIEKQQNTTLSGQFQHLWKITKYHTVRTVPIEK
jgi:hypothetical protein